MEAGLYVTINSDDPPMFNTTLTNEYLAGQKNFNWGQDTIEQLVLNAVQSTLLPGEEQDAMVQEFQQVGCVADAPFSLNVVRCERTLQSAPYPGPSA
jgi:adenosine deaminase